MKIERHAAATQFLNDNHLSVSMNGFVVTDQSWHQLPLPSPYSRLYYVMGGSGVLVSEDETVALEPGYVYLAPCGASCGFHGTDSVTKLFFHVNVILPDGYDLFAERRRFSRRQRSVREMEEMLEWYRSADPSKHVLLMGELWRTVSEFAAEDELPQNRSIHHSATVESAISYIRGHLSAGLTVSRVAEAAFCSTGHLSAAFSREMNTTVARYIEDLLMFEARRLLLSTDRSIGEISATLGFCDQFYFSRRFRKHFSVCPRSYRALMGDNGKSCP